MISPLVHTPEPKPQRSIVFVVREDDITATVNGVTGRACEGMTKFIRLASGIDVIEDRHTDDYYTDSVAEVVAHGPQIES